MKATTCKPLTGALVCLVCCLFGALLYSCAPQSSSNEQGEGNSQPQASTEPVAIQWSPETDCSLCHRTEAQSETDSACDASLHATMTCINCHTDETQLAKMHEGATTADRAPTRLKKTGIDKEGCLSCHTQADIAQTSAASTILTDVNGLTVNPHDIPDTPSHTEITCSDCHEMHSDASGRTEDAQKLCRSCHHQDVYECYTCHQHG